MIQTMQQLIQQYVSNIHDIYGSHLRQIIYMVLMPGVIFAQIQILTL